MNQIDQLHNQVAHAKIAEGIKARGYQCITVISDASGEHHPYHYSIGLSGMGFAEIFVSGRLPQEVAYSFIDAMVKRWKEEKGVVLGKFGRFQRVVEKYAHKMVSRKVTVVGTFPEVARQRNGSPVPMQVVWVSTDAQRQKDPEFMRLLHETYPERENIPVVQLLWPDDHQKLPGEEYTTDDEYKQELLPPK
jgi:hypothetical protein